MKKYLRAVFILLFSLLNLQAQNKNTSTNTLNKVTTNDDYNYIAINQMKMWIGNNGMGSHNPDTDGAGLLWPGGENAILNLVFEDGLIWGGYIGDSLYVNGSTYRQGLQAGKILSNGLADDPTLPKYRIYKIRKDWSELPSGPTRERYQRDYDEWPGNEGAPFYDSNNDGVFAAGIDKPLFLGDEVLWCVMNDLDPNRTLYTYGSMPIGLEIQMTVYGYTHPSLKNVLFKKYRVINKSNNIIDSMFFGYWSDPDLGFGSDDYVGCDTLMDLAYCYNGDDYDEGYFDNMPPALGYKLLQGPIVKSNTHDDSAKYNNIRLSGFRNLPMTSFNFLYNNINFWDPPCFGLIPEDIVQYNYLNGLICNGSPYLNPIDSLQTKYPFSGNPVDSTGWYMGYQSMFWPNDMRMFINTGPITMTPGDTQEVVIAIIAAQGSDNLQSITELKKTARTVQYFYDNYIPETVNVNYLPPLPEYYYLGQNYPNPFNPSTSISYELPVSGLVTLKVFDILGKEVSTLDNEEKSAGTYQVNFSSNGLSSGIYFYTLTSREYSKTKKMVLLR